MRRRVLQFGLKFSRHLAVFVAFLLLVSGGVLAQSGENHANDQAKTPSTSEAAKENQRKTDEFNEAAQAINGPAGNPECVWLGRRVVLLMYRDDLDTAFRHLDLYDRFGCPGGHIQAAFRCLTRFGALIDDKVPKSGVNDRIHACWINPGAQPPAAAAATTAAPPAATSGSAAPQPAASPSPAPAAAASPAAK
jgi:pyruvate/2-oxoglutarate dehydrogenase complex dihydrolipoamide acyltransferase (E2) component